MVLLDTLKASRRLQAAGFPEEQADELVATFAEDFGQNLATKDDIALLRKDLDLVRGEIRDMGRRGAIRMYLGLAVLGGLGLAALSIATGVLISVLS